MLRARCEKIQRGLADACQALVELLSQHVIPVANVSVNQTSKEKRVKLAQINTMGQTVRYVNVTITVAKLRYVTKLMANVIAVKGFKD